MTFRPDPSSKLLVAAVYAMAFTLASTPAQAHLVTTGLGPIYDGISHFVFSPEDLVPVFALALLAGLQGKEHGRHVLFILPTAWLIGGVVGHSSGTAFGTGLTWLPFVVLGGLLAADFRLPPRVTTVLAILLGLFHGYLNTSAMAVIGPDIRGLLGIVGTVFVFVTLVCAFVAGLRSDWARLAGRVIGSWIAASGLLLLAWTLRGGLGIA